MVEGGVIVYRLTADASEIERATAAASSSFEHLAEEGSAALEQLSRALSSIQTTAGEAIRLDPTQLSAGATQARQQLSVLQQGLANTATTSTEAQRRLTELGRSVHDAGGAWGQFGEAVSKALNPLKLLAGLATFQLFQGMAGQAKALFASAIEQASNLEETANKVAVVFDQSAHAIRQWAQTTVESAGLSRQAAMDAAAAFGNLLVTMGMGQQEAARYSQELVELAADLASFHNVSLAEAIRALQSGLVGETEPLRRFGVLLNETTVRAAALRMGIAGAKGELSESQKVLARLNEIFRQTATAQGDFDRTAQSLANTQRRFQAALDDLRASLGQALLPAMTQLANAATAALVAFQKLPEGLREGIAVFGALGAALAVLLPVLGGVAAAVATLGAPVVAVVAALGALAAAVVLVARHWDQLAERMPRLAGVLSAIGSAIRAVIDRLDNLGRALLVTAREGLAIWQRELERVWLSLRTTAELAGAVLSGRFSEIDDIMRQYEQRLGELRQANEQSWRAMRRAWRDFADDVEHYGGRVRQNISAYYQMLQEVQAAHQPLLDVAGVYGRLADAIEESDRAIGVWQRNLRQAREALEQLEEKRRAGVALSTEEQAQYELLTWYVGRLEGGIQDLETSQRALIASQAAYTRALDDLNAQLASGVITQEEYNRRVAELNDQYAQAIPPAEQFRNAGVRVAEALNQVVDRVRALLRELGLLPREVTINIRDTAEQNRQRIAQLNQEIDRLEREPVVPVHVETEPAERDLLALAQVLNNEIAQPRRIDIAANAAAALSELNTLRQRLDNLPTSFTIQAHVNVAPALEQIRTLGRHLPQSPAEEGPLSREPNWGWLFAGLVDAARGATKETLDQLRTFAEGLSSIQSAITSLFGIGRQWLAGGADLAGIVPWGDVIGWFASFAEQAVKELTRVTATLDGEALENGRALLSAVGEFLTVMRRVFEAAQQLEALDKDPWEHAWGEIRDWLIAFGRDSVVALNSALNNLNVAALPVAQEVAKSMDALWQLFGTAFSVAKNLSVEVTFNLQLLAAQASNLAQAVAQLAVTIADVVADSLRSVAMPPERDMTEELFAPLNAVVGVLLNLEKLASLTSKQAAALAGLLPHLGQLIVRFSTELAQQVGDAVVALGTQLPPREEIENLFAPLRAVLSLVEQLLNIAGSAQQARSAQMQRAVERIMDPVRTVLRSFIELLEQSTLDMAAVSHMVLMAQGLATFAESIASAVAKLASIREPGQALAVIRNVFAALSGVVAATPSAPAGFAFAGGTIDSTRPTMHFDVRVYVGDRELRDIVRTEIVEVLR